MCVCFIITGLSAAFSRDLACTGLVNLPRTNVSSNDYVPKRFCQLFRHFWALILIRTRQETQSSHSRCNGCSNWVLTTCLSHCRQNITILNQPRNCWCMVISLCIIHVLFSLTQALQLVTITCEYILYSKSYGITAGTVINFWRLFITGKECRPVVHR